ncbi:MAG TPA: YihY/virulence factor BrkB family protein [Caulobacteraceae bacterium]|jgi:membrane protein
MDEPLLIPNEPAALEAPLREPRKRLRQARDIVIKAFVRNWGRHVMLYTGGVSFFALLAVFPAFVIVIGLYGMLTTPEQAASQVSTFADLMPSGAETLIRGELDRLVTAPIQALSVQSIFALVITAYATHRGFKALLAGLQLIHDEEDADAHGFIHFNLLALFVAVAAFVLMIVASTTFLTAQLIVANFGVQIPWLFSEWIWAGLGLTGGLTLLYRYAMSKIPVAWTTSAIGGAGAALMSLVASWACAIYVENIAPLGATYGAVGAVVIFLIWLSWNVNAVFFGGALATEIECALAEPELDLGPPVD